MVTLIYNGVHILNSAPVNTKTINGTPNLSSAVLLYNQNASPFSANQNPLIVTSGTFGALFSSAIDGQAYAATEQSGAAIQGASGTISGSSLEGSNTDIADEFTKLIVTQQAYSANTKVITTANDMVQSLLNVLR